MYQLGLNLRKQLVPFSEKSALAEAYRFHLKKSGALRFMLAQNALAASRTPQGRIPVPR